MNTTIGIIDPAVISFNLIAENVLKLNKSTNFPSLEIFNLSNNQDNSFNIMPHVLLVNVDLLDTKYLTSLKSNFPYSKVIVCSSTFNLNQVYDSFRLGALSYLTLAELQLQLPTALQTTLSGKSFISEQISSAIVHSFQQTKLKEDLLTARELQVAEGILDGLSYKLIAHRCEISLDTVRVYIKRIYKKFRINSKSELMALMQHRIYTKPGLDQSFSVRVSSAS